MGRRVSGRTGRVAREKTAGTGGSTAGRAEKETPNVVPSVKKRKRGGTQGRNKKGGGLAGGQSEWLVGGTGGV